MKLNAAQHVSATLTARQSPKGRAGYQTLSYTRGLLSADELCAIERQVQNSPARDGSPRWQSYRLAERRHVVSRIVPIREPDDFGRVGRYFAHTLVFAVPAGPQFDDAVFGLLRPEKFLTSLERVLASEGARTGDAPAAEVEFGEGRGGAAPAHMRDWSGEQLNRLYMLMSDPRRLIDGGHHVALVGGEPRIVEALEIAFLLAPAEARKLCSFDTGAPDGAAQGVAFWGRGARSSRGASYAIDAARRQVVMPDSSPLREAGLSPEQLSPPLRQAVAARLSRPSERMLRRLVSGRYGAFVGEPVYETLLREGGLSLTAHDLELLSPFARAHGGLGLLLALKSGDDTQRLRRLAEMDSRSYTERCKQLRDLPGFRPWQMFSPVFMHTWFELFRGDYRLDDLTTAVSQVAAHGSVRDRNYVENLGEHLDPDERQALGRWLKSSSLRLARLQASLDAPARARSRRDARGRSHSFLSRVLHRLGK